MTSERRAFSVAVYARRDGRVLVIWHKRLQKWLPIGGELEPNELPFTAALRELQEETGMIGIFRTIEGALDGVPAGLLGYEEHMAGSKGWHLNFVFVCDIPDDQVVKPNDEFTDYRWVNREELAALESPLNVRQFGFVALDTRYGYLTAPAAPSLSSESDDRRVAPTAEYRQVPPDSD